MVINWGKCEGLNCDNRGKLYLFIDHLGLEARLCINCYKKYTKYLLNTKED